MKSPSQEEVSVIADANNNSNKVHLDHIKGERNGEKYSLRQRHKRLAAKGLPLTKLAMSPETKIKGKTKCKTAPLSKYRRKTANARERTRMREINFAFEKLRQCVPQSVNNDEQNLTNEKLTKITTLRLAMKYIRTLTEALNTSNNYGIISFLSENSTNCRDEDDNMTDIRLCSALDNNVGKSVNCVLDMNNSKTGEKCKCRTREKRKNHMENPDFLTLSLEPQLVLESDGESLPLSESCLSPFSQSIRSLDKVSPTENNLALNVLLDSDNDSVQFSEPSALSPLTCLESFNPFPDLLHTEFAISSSFDLYLT